MAEMGQQEAAGKPAPAMARGNRDRKYFGLIRRHSRGGKTYDPATNSQPMHQRVALAQHGFEFAFAPAAVKRCAVQLRQTGGVTQVGGIDRRGSAVPQFGQPCHHGEEGCDTFCSGCCDGLASGARCGSTLNGGGASAGQRSARISAALPTRYGAPNCTAPSASSTGPTRGPTNEPPSPLTT